MIQDHKKQYGGDEEDGSGLDKIRQKLSKIIDQEKEVKSVPTEMASVEQMIDKSDREVMLKILGQSCGCGGDDEYVDIKRVVPWDSPLQDGDIVKEYDDADEIW